jgi:hypothetical protein
VWHATGKLCYLVDLPVMKCDPPVWDLIIWTFINYKSVGLGFSRVHLLEWLYLFLYNISSANWLSCTKTIFFSCIYCISCGLFWSFSSLTAGVRWCGVGWMVSLCLVPSKHVGLSDQEEMLWTGWCIIIFYLHCASIQGSHYGNSCWQIWNYVLHSISKIWAELMQTLS